jgi:lipid-binding SYLF domain-containing protein
LPKLIVGFLERDVKKGDWGAPSMMALEGLSFGFQLGGQATDFQGKDFT